MVIQFFFKSQEIKKVVPLDCKWLSLEKTKVTFQVTIFWSLEFVQVFSINSLDCDYLTQTYVP